MSGIATWYAEHGRHDLPWRHSRDRWSVLVSEVMLQQTQVTRVRGAWEPFIARFPSPEVMAAAGPGAVIAAWGRLGYPRRARRLWETAALVTERGWPHDLRALPGIGTYTAAAIAAQADDTDVVAIEANVRRVVERVAGRRLTAKEAEAAAYRAGGPLRGRDRLLAIMDVGAVLCRPSAPRCSECPLAPGCASRSRPARTRRRRSAPFPGSFRQRRGEVLARLRDAPVVPADQLDPEALAALVLDGLAEIRGPHAMLPRSPAR